MYHKQVMNSTNTLPLGIHNHPIIDCKMTDEDIYNKLISKDPIIAFQYYQPFNIPWQLTGDKEQVFKTNRNIVELTMKQQNLPQFDLYLKKDYTKYYK